MKQFLLPLCLLACLALTAQNRRLHVLPGASGNGDGSSWQNAFTNLQSALAEAQAGDSVWVAEGVYFPDASDRTVSFRVKSGVRIFGGFSGTETELAARDWELYPATLSGAIGSIFSGDNSLHIAYLDSPDSNTVIDGFRFTKGVEDADTTDLGGAALFIWAKDTLGIPRSAARIRNCRFEGNNSVSYGGAVSIASYGAEHTRFERCTFLQNDARFGGAVGVSATKIHTAFIDCRFVSNVALEGGGAITLSAAQSGVRFSGCDFEKNRTKNSGGGAVNHAGASLPGEGVVFRDCRFSENICEINGYPEGGALFMGSWSGADTLLLENCIFRKNTGEKAGAVYIDQYGTAGSRYCIRDCRFEENESANVSAVRIGCSGGCSNKFIRSLDISGSFFLKNKGKALSIEGSASDTVPSVLRIDSCLFRENRNAAVFSVNIEGDARLQIDATEFSANKNGEVLVALVTQSTLTNCILDNNREAYWLMSWEEGTLNLRNCLFRNNQSQDFMFGANFGVLSAVNCHFDANTPGDDYPFPFFSADASITNSVFTGNTGTPYVVPGYMNPHFQHCFFAAPISNPPATLSLGPGNLIGGDPMFVDPAAGDFRLQPCSPLIGAGDNAAAAGWPVDIAGAARVQGGKVDIGILEAPAPQLAAPPLIEGSCPGKMLGSISLQPEKGCPPYVIDWTSGPASGQDTSGLLPGNYVFRITDARGSIATFPVTIPEKPGPALAPAVTPLDCGNSVGGTVVLNASGNAPLVFQWADDVDTDVRDSLPAGIYTVRATDAEGCITDDTISIGRQGRLKAALLIEPASCAGAADGQLSVTPQNGLAPFKWSWQTGDTTAGITNLGPGLYGLTLTDALGCSIRWMIPLVEPDVDCIGDEMAVFPNPFGEYLHIRTGFEPDETSSWILSDALGRTIRSVDLSGGGNRVDVRNLPAGFYIWQVRHRGRLLKSGKVEKR